MGHFICLIYLNTKNKYKKWQMLTQMFAIQMKQIETPIIHTL